MCTFWTQYVEEEEPYLQILYSFTYITFIESFHRKSHQNYLALEKDFAIAKVLFHPASQIVRVL